MTTDLGVEDLCGRCGCVLRERDVASDMGDLCDRCKEEMELLFQESLWDG